MADMWTPEKRSKVMAQIRKAGTKPELALHGIVKSALPRRSVIEHCATIPGRPDIFVPSLGLAIFVDGCFWHCCPEHGNTPRTRPEYWVPKLERNVARDRRVTRQLRRQGLGVWHVWEHDLRGPRLPATQARIAERLRRRAERCA